jgi:hypothetical protein
MGIGFMFNRNQGGMFSCLRQTGLPLAGGPTFLSQAGGQEACFSAFLPAEEI